MSEDSKIVITSIIKAIRDSNNEELIKLLNMLPLYRLSLRKSDELLYIFLTTATESNNNESIERILFVWSEVYPASQYPAFHSVIFLNPLYDMDTLRFMVKSLRDVSFLEVLDDFINMDSNDEVLAACNKAVEVFGEQSLGYYKIILENAIQLQNYKVQEFAETKIEELEDFAPIPVWVKNFTKSKELPFDEDVKIPSIKRKFSYKIPCDIRLVDMMVENTGFSGSLGKEEKDQMKRNLLLVVSGLPEKTKAELIREIFSLKHLSDLQNNRKLFRVLGPANPLVGSDEEQLKYGGSRMFIADEFDFNEDSGLVIDWFNGSCIQCHKRIRRRWHAVRRPLIHGGWIGSYCSWNCARESINDEIHAGVSYLVDYYDKKINEMGIQDRLNNPEPNEIILGDNLETTIDFCSKNENEDIRGVFYDFVSSVVFPEFDFDTLLELNPPEEDL